MFLPWRNSATEMFVNLGINSFDQMLRIYIFGFRSRVTTYIISCYQVYVVHTVVYIQSYGHGGTVYCIL